MNLLGDQGDNLSFETHYIPPLKELVTELNCVCSCSELDFCPLWLLSMAKHELINVFQVN